ncbi:hypothetical protein D3C77_411430 [compost metagenome]
MMEKKNNRKLVCIIIGITLILMTQGCNDEQVISERQPDHHWFSPSVVDDVYEPAIVEDVYSKQ